MDRSSGSSRLLIVGALALAALGVASPALAGAMERTRLVPPTTAPGELGSGRMEGIAVHGTGRVTLAPDTATVSIGVDAQEASAQKAQDAASTRMSAVVRAIQAMGIADEDVTTQNVSLTPTYDYSGSTQRLTGYAANQALSVKVRKLTDLGPLIDTSVTAGATQIGGINFSVGDPQGAMDQARAAAVADARHRAESLARAAGVNLGSPVSVTEGGSTPPPPIIYAQPEAAMRDAATPISPGTTEVSVDVDIVFSIVG